MRSASPSTMTASWLRLPLYVNHGLIADGDLSANMDAKSTDEIGMVQNAMGTMVSNLQGMVARIKQATDGLASSSEELSATALALEKGSEDQSSRIDQSAAAMIEMSQTTAEVAQNSSETSDAARLMRRIAAQGREAMHSSVSELSRFADSVQESAAIVEALGSKSEEIDAVVELIKEIADQTNLLSLNAAIEAARAGEHGLGFAVVADNVRKLARRTTEATGEIGGTVKEIQASVTRSVACMRDERESVARVLENVNKTLSSIDEIVACVEKVSDMVQTIAVSAEEQSVTSSDVSDNMDSIATITRQLKEAFADIRHSSDDLSRLANELNGMVGWFKV